MNKPNRVDQRQDDLQERVSLAERTGEILLKLPIADAYLICLWGNQYTLKAVSEMESRFGLNRDDCNVLLSLGSFGPMTASEISSINGRPKNSISRAVGRMFDMQSIIGVKIIDDRRRVELSLTPSGQKLYQDMIPVFVDIQRAMLQFSSASERESLRTVLRRNLEAVVE